MNILSEGGFSAPLQIGGLLKFSTLDYPGKLCSVIFCQGCSMRCSYCHNPDFQDISKPGKFVFEDVLDFLKTRIGLLEAVVFSGGEPLLQQSLKESVKRVKELGFLVGVHTAGMALNIFDDILEIVDWVGLDIKTSFENYEKVTGVIGSGELAKSSFEKLINSGVEFETRTTFDSRYISEDDLHTIANTLAEKKVKKWILQECVLRKDNKEDETLLLPSTSVLENISKVIEVELRRQ